MFFGSTKPYNSINHNYSKKLSFNSKKGIRVFPIPTKFRIPYWFTLEFTLPKKIVDFIFKINVQNSDFFYVLIHPADFLDSNDLKHIEGSHSLERIDKDYGLKNQRFIERLELLIKSGFTFTTFDTLII